MSSKLDRLIDELNRQVDNEFDNFDPDYFDPDYFDEGYDLDRSKAGGLRPINRVMSQAPARRAVPSGIGTARVAPAKNPFPNVSTQQINRYTGEFAQFDIKINRVSNNINQPLPVAIFGALADANNYQQVLLPLSPDNSTLSITRTGTTFRFTYTVGSNTDHIDVTCQQTPYPALVRASQFDLLKIAGIRYSLSNAANTVQFNNAIIIDERSIFGGKRQNEITPSTYVSPDQFQSGIVDITQGFETDKETTVITSISPFSNFSINLSLFVAKWTKYNKSNVL